MPKYFVASLSLSSGPRVLLNRQSSQGESMNRVRAPPQKYLTRGLLNCLFSGIPCETFNHLSKWHFYWL